MINKEIDKVALELTRIYFDNCKDDYITKASILDRFLFFKKGVKKNKNEQ